MGPDHGAAERLMRCGDQPWPELLAVAVSAGTRPRVVLMWWRAAVPAQMALVAALPAQLGLELGCDQTGLSRADGYRSDPK